MTSLFYTTQDCKHPFQDVAPHIQTGSKLPYNIKVVRGRATFAAAGVNTATPVYDIQYPTRQIIFNPNTVVLAVGLYTTALTAATVFSVGTGQLGVAAIVDTIASLIPRDNIVAGCAVKYGAYGGAGVNAALLNHTIVTSTPYIENTTGTCTGVITVTFLLMETAQ